MRFGYHFQPGRELQGGQALTSWLRTVREHVREASRRVGRPIQLGVRVPSRPDTARSLGMDAVAWARAGLVDLVVPTPFWETCEFHMPIGTWRRLLESTNASLAGGLEIRYQPMRGGEAQMMTPELAAGAAAAVLAGGAENVYLFNYFLKGHLDGQWTPAQFAATLNAMTSSKTLYRLPRTHAVTFPDIQAPGVPDAHPLPAEGTTCSFRMQTGPRPEGRDVSVLIQLEGDDASATPPELRVNSIPCPPGISQEDGALRYILPPEALADEMHLLEVTSPDTMRIIRVEFIVK